MATAGEIEEVRDYIAELTEDGGWTDARIARFIDREDNLWLAAAAIWSAKSGEYAGLVNISESGSSRSLGSLIDNALRMAAFYKQKSSDETVIPTGEIIISKLVRP